MGQNVGYLKKLFEDRDNMLFYCGDTISYMARNGYGDICVTIIKMHVDDDKYPIYYRVIYRMCDRYCIEGVDHGELFDYITDLFKNPCMNGKECNVGEFFY